MFKRLMFIYTVLVNPKISKIKILKQLRNLIKAETLNREKSPEDEKDDISKLEEIDDNMDDKM